MSRLNAKKRNALPEKKFGLPGAKGKGKAKGKYPVDTKARARAALSRDSEELAKGNLSPAQAAEIKHKAYHVLGHGDSNYHNKG